MRMLVFALPLLLTGCVTATDREVTAWLDNYYSRADVDAINAEMACKQLARTLVQISRCANRR